MGEEKSWWAVFLPYHLCPVSQLQDCWEHTCHCCHWESACLAYRDHVADMVMVWFSWSVLYRLGCTGTLPVFADFGRLGPGLGDSLHKPRPVFCLCRCSHESAWATTWECLTSCGGPSAWSTSSLTSGKDTCAMRNSWGTCQVKPGEAREPAPPQSNCMEGLTVVFEFGFWKGLFGSLYFDFLRDLEKIKSRWIFFPYHEDSFKITFVFSRLFMGVVVWVPETVYVRCMCLVPWDRRRVLGPWNWHHRQCELPCGSWPSSPESLKEQTALLTTEPPFQHLV